MFLWPSVIVPLKSAVFLRPESLDNTQNDFSSPLLGTVLGDLTPGTPQTECYLLQNSLSSDDIWGDSAVGWHFITQYSQEGMHVPLVLLCDRKKAFCMEEKTIRTIKNFSLFLLLSNCHPQQCIYLFGDSHLLLRPDSLRAPGRGRGFASQNASTARGSVRRGKHHNEGSLCSFFVYNTII